MPSPSRPGRTGRHRGATGTVGMVGGGQLARMTCEAAHPLDLRVIVLAEDEADAAVAVATDVVMGRPTDAAALRALADRSQVVTFDHEQVDVDLVATLEDEGVVVRPAPSTLRMSVDKATMRRRLADAGVPVPPHALLGAERWGDPTTGWAGEAVAVRGEDDPRARAGRGLGAALADEVAAFAGNHGWPVVLKAVRGGYDGKGVWPAGGPEDARRVCERAVETGTRLLVEEHVDIDAELAVLVARRPRGEVAAWPAVQTVQVGGVCREVLFPGCLDGELAAQAQALARRVADVAGSTGVLAVELFLSSGRLLVNELAARPHNSGHWTIEGAVTSQFENHLRAVLDLPLGSTTAGFPAVASVNVFGGPDSADPLDGLATALAVDGAHVHLYGKQARPGRKLGHVTVCGDDQADVRARARRAALALGTPERLA